ncbi:hypothetical protein WG68_08560 [Arsukibacterium ikkense]|uniref:Uncharacterized protein n=1 Tax=Arsukibacterium ikkense TaxID=336831 RepID=A0A0M2V9B2_9GAMM|nr:RING finger protein [Arsukibacterium ikkense]KKO45758.1 hypothetical protein WG68_08560 [Arsukibacterium ikkense]
MAASTLCKSCNSQVLSNSKKCPVCNSSISSNRFIKIVKIALVAVIAVPILSAILTAISGYEGTTYQATAKPLESDYADAKVFDYRAAALQNIPRNELIRVNGVVIQTYGKNAIRLGTKRVFGGFFEEDVYLTFSEAPQILEGDTLEIKARYQGVQIFETILKTESKVPHLHVDYYSVSKMN